MIRSLSVALLVTTAALTGAPVAAAEGVEVGDKWTAGVDRSTHCRVVAVDPEVLLYCHWQRGAWAVLYGDVDLGTVSVVDIGKSPHDRPEVYAAS